MKNTKIVEGLTEKQKISLLTDRSALSAPWLDTLGVPKLSVAEYVALVKDTGVPSLDVLASTFDFSLVREVGKYVGELATKKGANFVVSPDISVDLSPEGKGFSEDPYLCGLLGSAMLSGFKGAGCSAAVSDLAVRESDFDYTDTNIDDCVIRDFFLKPMELAALSADCDAVVSTESVPVDDESETGRLQRLFKNDVFPDAARIVGSASTDGTVASINDKTVLCLNGSGIAISAALDNYRKMRHGIDDGSVTISELEKAVTAGSAISEKTVNEAVDNVISFMFSCYKRRRPPEPATSPDILEYAYLRSAVLLKNAATLPISKGQRVATIGPLPKGCEFTTKFAEICAANGITYIGHAQGYDMEAELGGNLMPEAVTIAQSADITIVFLDEPSGRTSVSANRIEILNLVNKTKGKTVAVCLNRAIGLDIDGIADAIMLATLNGTNSETALCKLLLGYASPSGKLAKTIYRDRVRYYNDVLKKDIAADRIGRFLGYRLYDTAGIDEVYPFGHGLTYSNVRYSSLLLRDKVLSFTIENKGKFPITESAEIYIGKKASSLAVPQKELKCVVSRDLKPGEKTRVSMSLDFFEKSLSALDSSDGKSAIEAGEYNVYIGRSLFDIRLKTSFKLDGRFMARETRQTPSILKVSSNIHTGAYKLNDNRKDSTKNPMTTLFILTVVMAALADIALPLIMHYQPDMRMLSYILLGAINGLLLIMFIAFVVVTVKRRNRARLKAARTEYDEEQWDLESLSDVLPLTELFADMDISGVEKRTRTGRRKGVQDNYDKSQYIDQSLSFDALCKRYVKHLSLFGVGITVQKAKAVLAAIGSSRLLVLRGEDKNLMRVFASATSRFFGSPDFYADAKGFRMPFDVFSDNNGIKSAVTYAVREPHKMAFVAMDGVDMRKIRSYFTPMIAAFANVTQSFTVDIKNSTGEKTTYVIPPNMWFMMTESSPVNAPLPSFVTDFGAIINLKLTTVPSAGKAGLSDGVSYEQYTWMTDTCRNSLNFDEANWKKIDKLEDYMSSRIADYTVGNKKWGRLEKFVSVYCACDGSESGDRADAMREALDYTVAINLVHGMASALIGRPNPESSSLLDAVDRIIGQDYDFETASAIKIYKSEGVSR